MLTATELHIAERVSLHRVQEAIFAFCAGRADVTVLGAQGPPKPLSTQHLPLDLSAALRYDVGMDPESSTIRKFRTTMDLFDTAVDIMRENLRRRNPEARPEEIQSMLQDWLLKKGEPVAPLPKAGGKSRA